MSITIPRLALGPLMMDLQGTEITAQERTLLQSSFVGGVILFTRNFASYEQLCKLVTQIKSLRSPSLLVAVDHEGGRVQRFRETFTVLPALAHIGACYEHDQNMAIQAAKAHAWIMASELLATSIDFSFAPVLDRDVGLSSVIGDRAFHSDKEVVGTLGKAYIQGLHEAGMIAVGKHFPGHGHVKGDSHVEKPIDHRNINDIMQTDGLPFVECIHAGLDALMPAHVIYEHVDNCPAGYSALWLKQILRDTYNFEGMLFSDDLSMSAAEANEAVSLSYEHRAEKALCAGCDMILLCNNIQAVQELIQASSSGVLSEYQRSAQNQQSAQRRLAMQGKKKSALPDVRKTPIWQQARNIVDTLTVVSS